MSLTQNLDKLPPDALDLVALCFEHVIVWGIMPCNMIEVKLDDPIHHILEGGDGFRSHGGNGSGCYLHHAGDPEWAVVASFEEYWADMPQAEMSERAFVRWIEPAT